MAVPAQLYFSIYLCHFVPQNGSHFQEETLALEPNSSILKFGTTSDSGRHFCGVFGGNLCGN